MRTITKTVYNFSELSDKAKRSAILNSYDVNLHDDWWDAVYEDFYQICDILGIELKTRRNGKSEEKRVWFSGFSCQGDGACFEAYYFYKPGSCKEIREYAPTDKKLHAIADALKYIQKSNFYQLRAETDQIGRYFSMSVSVERNDGKKLTGHAEESVKEALRDLAQWLYRSLEEEHDFLTSDQIIIETLEANEYEFTESGERI